jgi:ADP-ribosylglycohydrolase
VSTQLAAFSLEGAIRAMVRADHKGICHPPSVVWHAYCRWAYLQGIAPDAMRAHWADYTHTAWPDGWLAQVPALAERRGSAPATVTALTKLEPGTADQPATSSRGCHALTRTLPLAALLRPDDPNVTTEFAADVAALTHGHPDAQVASLMAVHVARFALLTGSVTQAARTPFVGVNLRGGSDLWRRAEAAHDDAIRQPRDNGTLARLAPSATADAAFLGGLYTALSFPEPGDAMDALRFAAATPDGGSVAAVTGALLGATHGVEVWPTDLLGRLELTWVLDTLARDLVTQLTDQPGGTEYTPAPDPHWWDRYPGW